MSEISILPYLRSLIDFCYNDGTWTKASAGVHRLAEKPPPLARRNPRLHFSTQDMTQGLECKSPMGQLGGTK